MRSIWNNIPLIRISIPLIAGVALGVYCLNAVTLSVVGVSVAVMVLCLLLLAVIQLQNTNRQYRWRLVSGGAAMVLLFTLGWLLTWLNTDTNYSSHFKNYIYGQPVLTVRIIQPPVQKEKTLAAVAEVTAIHNRDSTTYTTGKILLYILRSAKPVNLHYGDVVTLTGKVEEFAAPKNPGEFNFKRYQAYHNIYHRVFLAPGSWRFTASGEGNLLLSKVYAVRAYFLNVLNRYVTGADNFAVAAAIMLGYNDYMTTDIMRAYTNAGTLHVLSVSGLHVGVMFLMLNFLLGWAGNQTKKARIGKAVFIIGFMWFYACLTGLSPSVLRSALMFSLIQIGLTMARHVNMYNIVAGSALVLIVINPFIVTEVGFQLSYLAVLGIVFMYPKIYALVPIGSSKPKAYKRAQGVKGKLQAAAKHDWRWLFIYGLNFVWSLVAVSLAAQLATLPLSLYYFHQFPNWFLLANIVIIPLSNFVLFTGTALCALGEIAVLNTITGAVFNGLLTALNNVTFLIDAIPYNVTDGISITLAEMLLLYLLLLLFGWLTVEPRSKVFIAGMAIVVVLVTYNSAERIQQSRQKKMIVYSVPKQQAISLISGNRSYNLFDDSLSNNPIKLKNQINPYRYMHDVSNNQPVQALPVSGGHILQFEGKTILVIDSSINHHTAALHNRLQADWVIVSHNPRLYIDELQHICNFKLLVFDSSNKNKRLQQWKEDCERLNIPYYDVSRQGAYIAEL